MNKTPEELAALRVVAEAATNGPWERDVFDHDPGDWEVVPPNDIWDGETFVRLGKCTNAQAGRDAKHIASFDPPTVIALLDELKQLREFVAGIASTVCDYETTREYFANDPCRGRCDSCTARELLKGLNE